MATVFTHAAVPWLIARELPRRQRLAVAVVACVADLDLLGAAFDVRPESLFGHRGATHSLLAAVLIGALFAFLLRGPLTLRRALAWFIGAALSHGVIDLFTEFESGVALLAPWNERFLAFVRPVPAIPLGLDELLSRWGALVLLNEALFVVAPVVLVLRAPTRRRAALFVAAWVLGGFGLSKLFPAAIAPQRVRVIEFAKDLPKTPMSGVPGDTWVTNVNELEKLGLFNRALTPAQAPWSSGFFPSWFGREAGRWKDPRLTLIARTAFGTRAPSTSEVETMTPEELDRLSPIEKYDLAMGDADFKATKESLSTSHNARPYPRFWNGLCNGVSAAAMERPEPVFTVEVISRTGRHVRFHPQDIKALLALGYYFPASDVELGGSCDVVRFDAPRVCAMNPALLLLATANALGRARQSFQLDVHATEQAQYYAVASAELRTPSNAPRLMIELAPNVVVHAIEVDFVFELSSTTLPPGAANVPVKEGVEYEPVGVKPVHFKWRALVALDGAGEVIGGKWYGDGPDSLVFPSGGPELLEGRVLTVNPGVEWAFIDRLAQASGLGQQSPARVIDLR